MGPTHIQIPAQLYLECQRTMNSIFKSLEEEWKFNLTNEYNKVLNLCKLMYLPYTQRSPYDLSLFIKSNLDGLKTSLSASLWAKLADMDLLKMTVLVKWIFKSHRYRRREQKCKTINKNEREKRKIEATLCVLVLKQRYCVCSFSFFISGKAASTITNHSQTLIKKMSRTLPIDLCSFCCFLLLLMNCWYDSYFSLLLSHSCYRWDTLHLPT